MHPKYFLLCALVAPAAMMAADPPYAGSWKVDMAKSNLAGPTVTYQKLASGDWQSTADGHSYKFKMDGADYADGYGDMAVWKEIGPTEWQTVWKLNGNVLSTDSLKVGADGLLTVNTTGTKPNGETINDTTVFQRVSGGPGLAGKWKSKTQQSASPDVMQLVASAGNGLAFKDPSMGMNCDSKLDGKDYACTGPTLSAGWTIAMTKTGASSFRLMVKKDGKPLYRYAYAVSADGTTLTATGGSLATNEKVTLVYQRQ